MAQPISTKEVTYLSDTAARIVALGEALARAEAYPVGREEDVLRLSAELHNIIEDLRDRAITASLEKRKLSIREIGRIVGMTPSGVHKRGRSADVDMSRQPLDSMTWRRTA